MTPRYALDLDPGRVELLVLRGMRWLSLAAEEVGDDPAAALAALHEAGTRHAAMRGEADAPLGTRVVVPAEHLLYLRLDDLPEDGAERFRAIRRALVGRTPYAVEELAFDWYDLGPGEAAVCAVALETLDEAEAVVRAAGFAPLALVAAPDPDAEDPAEAAFSVEPYLGTGRAAADLLPEGGTVARGAQPVRAAGDYAPSLADGGGEGVARAAAAARKRTEADVIADAPVFSTRRPEGSAPAAPAAPADRKPARFTPLPAEPAPAAPPAAAAAPTLRAEPGAWVEMPAAAPAPALDEPPAPDWPPTAAAAWTAPEPAAPAAAREELPVRRPGLAPWKGKGPDPRLVAPARPGDARPARPVPRMDPDDIAAGLTRLQPEGETPSRTLPLRALGAGAAAAAALAAGALFFAFTPDPTPLDEIEELADAGLEALLDMETLHDGQADAAGADRAPPARGDAADGPIVLLDGDEDVSAPETPESVAPLGADSEDVRAAAQRDPALPPPEEVAVRTPPRPLVAPRRESGRLPAVGGPAVPPDALPETFLAEAAPDGTAPDEVAGAAEMAALEAVGPEAAMAEPLDAAPAVDAPAADASDEDARAEDVAARAPAAAPPPALPDDAALEDYAVTGIWQVAPEPQQAPRPETAGGIEVAAALPLAAVPVPPAALRRPADREPPIPVLLPPTPQQSAARADPTEDGAEGLEGVLIYAGLPPRRPPARPEAPPTVLGVFADQSLADYRPRSRPNPDARTEAVAEADPAAEADVPSAAEPGETASGVVAAAATLADEDDAAETLAAASARNSDAAPSATVPSPDPEAASPAEDSPAAEGTQTAEAPAVEAPTATAALSGIEAALAEAGVVREALQPSALAAAIPRRSPMPRPTSAPAEAAAPEPADAAEAPEPTETPEAAEAASDAESAGPSALAASIPEGDPAAASGTDPAAEAEAETEAEDPAPAPDLAQISTRTPERTALALSVPRRSPSARPSGEAEDPAATIPRPRARPTDPGNAETAFEPEGQPQIVETTVSGFAVAVAPRPHARSSDVARRAAEALAARRETAEAAPAAAPARAAPSAAPQLPTRASVARAATTPNALPMGKVALAGVYLSRSSRSALVRLASGRYVKVQVGARLDGGRVQSIGSGTLTYVKGGRAVTLRMPRG